jgi:hypothetical protein
LSRRRRAQVSSSCSAAVAWSCCRPQ